MPKHVCMHVCAYVYAPLACVQMHVRGGNTQELFSYFVFITCISLDMNVDTQSAFICISFGVHREQVLGWCLSLSTHPITRNSIKKNSFVFLF